MLAEQQKASMHAITILFLLLIANAIFPATNAHHRGSCVAAGYRGCCISNCRVGSCYCNQRCYRLLDCCNDIEQIGCYSHGTSFGTTRLLSSIQMPTTATSELISTSPSVILTSHMPKAISPTTPWPSSSTTESLTMSPVSSEALLNLTFTITASQTELPVPSQATLDSTTQNSVAIPESKINSVKQTSQATNKYTSGSAVVSFVSIDAYTKDNDYSSIKQAISTAISTTLRHSFLTPEKMSTTKSTNMIQPTITSAIGAAQEGLSVPWITLAVTLPLTMIIITVLIIVLIWCFAIRKRAKNTSFSSNTNQHPSAKSVHELNYVQHSTSQSMEHIYSVPQREARSSMIYNQAYMGSFAITINAAYTPTMNMSK